MEATTASKLFRFSMIYNWIFQPRGPETGEIFLHQRRVFIFPTRYGFFFAFSLLGFLASSINYDLSLGFVLTFFLGAAGLVAMLHTFRNQLHLYLKPLKAEPVFAGSEASFDLLLENRKGYERAAIWLKTVDAETVTDIAPYQSVNVTLTAPAVKRGWLTLPRITVETRYPLGLLRSWSYWQPDLPCLVYPKPAPTGMRFPDAPEGSGEGAPTGPGAEDFAGLREHQVTDSPRHIAWKNAILAMETGMPLLVKHFHGAASSEVVLDYDTLPPAMDMEQRLSLLTRWVLDADALKFTYALKLQETVLGPAGGDPQRLSCLRALALFGVAP
ncbi:MAG: hypothetical protein JWN73_765 [Betaproteobacteria bacterium]|nr:hypothetical protein [Betaproteobacteria bacterium]